MGNMVCSRTGAWLIVKHDSVGAGKHTELRKVELYISFKFIVDIS